MDFAASVLKPRLEAAGLQVYMDYSKLKPGMHWQQELAQAAANSAVVVVVLSGSYVNRYWCQLELDLALHSRKHAGHDSKPVVIPVFWDKPDDVVQPHAIQQYWQQQLNQLAPARLCWVDPARWAGNIGELGEQWQGERRMHCGPKDNLYNMAGRVAQAAGAYMPKKLTIDTTQLFGQTTQMEGLLAKIHGGRMGLWLFGPGNLVSPAQRVQRVASWLSRSRWGGVLARQEKTRSHTSCERGRTNMQTCTTRAGWLATASRRP